MSLYVFQGYIEHGVKAGLAHNDISIEDGFDSNIKSSCADPDFSGNVGWVVWKFYYGTLMS